MQVLFDANQYEVRLLNDPIPVENHGVTLYFNYEVFNNVTGRTEGYSQFLPAAIEQANMLDETLQALMEESETAGEGISDTDGKVVKLNS